jgi:hypothetical protein
MPKLPVISGNQAIKCFEKDGLSFAATSFACPPSADKPATGG